MAGMRAGASRDRGRRAYARIRTPRRETSWRDEPLAACRDVTSSDRKRAAPNRSRAMDTNTTPCRARAQSKPSGSHSVRARSMNLVVRVVDDAGGVGILVVNAQGSERVRRRHSSEELARRRGVRAEVPVRQRVAIRPRSCAAGSPAGSGTARARPRSCRAPRRSPRRGCRRRPGRRRTCRARRAGACGPSRRGPSASTSSIASAASATGARDRRRAARTSAKSRTRRSRRLAMRGVPRERRAISSAPSASIAIVEQPRRARDDARQLLRRVELEPRDDAEAVAQRVGQHAGARGRADQRERRQVELDRARRRALADHDVDLEVLERRIEDLLDDRRQAVDLVDEQHVVAARGW